MRSFCYPAILQAEEAGFTVTFPDIPEAITSGDGRQDALVQAADCLDEAIAGRIVDGMAIPEPSRPKRGQVPIAVPPLMAAKAALYLAMRHAEISNVELARRLKCDEKEVRRMLDPKHATKMARLQQAVEILGQTLVIGMDIQAA